VTDPTATPKASGLPHILTHFAPPEDGSDWGVVNEVTANLAQFVGSTLPASAELSAGLRKLLEAKDCFDRAAREQRA